MRFLPLILVVLSLSGCDRFDAFREEASDFIVSFVPTSVDEQLGAAGLEEMRGGAGFIEDPRISRTIGMLAAPLIEQAREDLQVPYQVYVTADLTVNAYALPGGAVILPAGFLLFAERPEEVAGVLAHEVAHISERHSMQRAITGIGLQLVLTLVLNDMSAAAQYFAVQGASLLTLAHSREHEREADRLGYDYLVEAGIDPSGLADFFRRLAAREGESAAGLPGGLDNMLRTHPVTRERIETLAALSRGQPGEPGSPAVSLQEFQEMQRRLAGIVGDQSVR